MIIDGIKFEHPEREEWGDLAVFMKPGPEAEKLIKKLEKLEFTESVTRVGGFINIRLQMEYLVEKMSKAVKLPQTGKGKTVIVEYSSPNIAKPFGIGHLRSTIIGQALYNIYKALGYKTIGDNHLGDWGTQFGKLLFMIDREKIKDLTIEKLEQLYVEFHKHPEWEPEGQKWFKKLEDGDKQARKLWKECVQISMTEFDRIYKLLGIKIDNVYGESSYEELMLEVIADAKSIAKVSQGATIIEIPGEKIPLMLLKSDGGTTYATRDLATVKFRAKKWHPDLVIYEVGGEQTLHFKQVFAAAKLLGYVTSVDSLIHTKHGLYLDTDGKKFSTRKGKTVKLEEVLEEATQKARNNEAVGIGAIKYFDLSHNIQSDIIFDWDTIMALEGNSGPYLQYTYARICSVLAKSTTSLRSPSYVGGELNPEELAILRWIYRFPEVVEEAASRYAPNLICNFLYELAQRYNSFYSKHSILTPSLISPYVGGETPQGEGVLAGEVRAFRLAMTKSVGEVLKLGLNLLGIEAPERM